MKTMYNIDQIMKKIKKWDKYMPKNYLVVAKELKKDMKLKVDDGFLYGKKGDFLINGWMGLSIAKRKDFLKRYQMVDDN